VFSINNCGEETATVSWLLNFIGINKTSHNMAAENILIARLILKTKYLAAKLILK
jgi:hypothetical protein